MANARTWKAVLGDRISAPWGQEIDVFETQMELRRQGRIDEKLFAETRLRRGVYGQRYDNGQRHDGEQSRTLDFPSQGLTKGPGTVWDAPGMMRIKIPMGKLGAAQLEVMAELAEEYSDAILHVTTRQDVQLHFVHIDDTPDMMRRLAAVGITTREACGNSVRNVTACPLAGVCHGESFDVMPYAQALTFFLLGHPDTQDFGRKVKIAFSGCEQGSCGLTNFHDVGCIARQRTVDGRVERGFAYYVGGGLGAVPHAAKLLEEFLPVEELLPMTQAVSRVFARLGEKENRARARLKFLVQKLGVQEFRRLVLEERAKLRPGPAWTAYLGDLGVTDERPLRPAGELPEGPQGRDFEEWRATNVRAQAQQGYQAVTVTLPLGDLSATQARGLASIARRFTGDTLRATVEQNLLLRWVSSADLPAVYAELRQLGLGAAGASTIQDVTSCPGTDTCKLGISSSRGLAGELRRRLSVLGSELDPAAQALHIKCSGCFNSCGQHHVADLGFLGVSRLVEGRRVPHFQVVLGGQWEHNGGAYGLAIGALPSKRVPEAVERLTSRYATDRQPTEGFRDFVQRIGKKQVRALLEDLMEVPRYETDRSFYSDWGDPREYTIGDMGVGECAGEVVPFVEMTLAAAEREVFEAQVLLDDGNTEAAAERAYSAMTQAALALTREVYPNIGRDPDEVLREFRARLVDTRLFHDPFAGGKFAAYYFKAHAARGASLDVEGAHQLIEESQLFVEAAHACYQRTRGSAAAAQ